MLSGDKFTSIRSFDSLFGRLVLFYVNILMFKLKPFRVSTLPVLDKDARVQWETTAPPSAPAPDNSRLLFQLHPFTISFFPFYYPFPNSSSGPIVL